MLQGSVKGHNGVFWSQLEQRGDRHKDYCQSLCAEDTHTGEGMELEKNIKIESHRAHL